MKRQFSRSGNRAILSGGRVIAGAVVLIVLALFALRAVFPDAVTTFSRPLWFAGDMLTAAVASATNSFEHVDEIRTERDTLKAELEAERNKNAVLSARAADFARLAGSLTTPQDRILASVLVRPPVSPYDTLVVGAGARAGVRVGAGVFGPGGVPLGTVEIVSEEYAHVALYSGPTQTTEGWVGEARLPITITGAGAGAFRATVPKDAALVIGEQVFVPGAGALPIGSIARIDTNPSSPTSLVYIRPLVNPFTLTWVAIGEALP